MDDEDIARAVVLIFMIVIFIIVIIVGGAFRTEVKLTFPGRLDGRDDTRFEERFTARHWLVGLIKGKQPDVQKSLSKYVRQGEQIAQITIITKHTWDTALVTGITLGIFCPQKVVIRGTIKPVQETSVRSGSE